MTDDNGGRNVLGWWQAMEFLREREDEYVMFNGMVILCSIQITKFIHVKVECTCESWWGWEV